MINTELFSYFLLPSGFYVLLILYVESLEELQMQASALRDECEQEKQTMKELCQFKDEQVQKARYTVPLISSRMYPLRPAIKSEKLMHG